MRPRAKKKRTRDTEYSLKRDFVSDGCHDYVKNIID